MRRRTWIAAGAAVVVLAAGAVGAWLWTAASTASSVSVSWREGDPTCTGTTVEQTQKYGTVVEAVPDMRCTYRVEVHNGSGRSVHLDRVVAPYVGPGTGAVVTADPDSADSSIDATFDLDQDLDAGGSTYLDIVVVFHPEGCNDSGTLSVPDWPTVRFETLRRTFEVTASEMFAFHRTGRTPGCRG